MPKAVPALPNWLDRVQPALDRYLSDYRPDVEAALQSADSAKGYLHWDEFRHRPAPAGFDQEDLWALVKLRRREARPLELLRDRSGTPLRLVRGAPMEAALHRIDTQEVLWRELSRVEGTDSEITYRLMAAIEEAHHSSAIEGAVTTRRRSNELIRSGGEPRNTSERMVLNNFHTIERLDEWAKEPLTSEMLLAMHASVSAGTLQDSRDEGRVRTDDDVRVWNSETNEVVYVPPPAKELDERIDRLCTFANQENTDEQFIHPVARAILLHYQLAADHPFVDGNGRTARALFMWGILRAGYAWFRSLSISRAVYRARSQYYRSFLYVQTDQGDATYFVRHQLSCIEREIMHLAEFLRDRARIEEWLRERKAVSKALNARQLALLDHALVHSDAEFTALEHGRYHGVSQPTAWKDLTSMRDEGLLEETKKGRLSIYLVSKKLRKLASERPAKTHGLARQDL